MPLRLLPITGLGLVGGVLLAGELLHWRASRRGLGSGATDGEVEAVVVLGFRNRGSRANYLNRYRVRSGVRTLGPTGRGVLVLCGGPVGGDIAEADLMARYARERLGWRGPIRLDRTSATTWENIRNAIPLIEDARTIAIVSNSLHAEKGRAYLRRMRPDLAARLVRGREYRVGEILLLKPLLAVVGVRNLRRLR